MITRLLQVLQSKNRLLQVLQSIARLLGGEEECWMELQAMVTRMGEGSLKRRAMSCEVETIPPEMWVQYRIS